MTQYEYKRYIPAAGATETQIDAEINAIGADGWSLASVHAYTESTIYTFSRQLPKRPGRKLLNENR